MKSFNGKVLFLDRNDINTDELVPAKYLTEVDKKALKPYLLEGLKLDNFSKDKIMGKKAIITRTNFGCGSSREHAPWALEANEINIVVAESFARIFRQNMFNCGMLAIELKSEAIFEIFSVFSGLEADIITDIEKQIITLSAGKISKNYSFNISSFDKELVFADGWVNYADLKY
ncbi:MAG: 3-isopropylmalate dehydratase small subunit [Spirochaetaceae bacterium]|nr:3-isopropylmalate dehydratase small subunit [Spirochaetaceae bacterium]